jgi:hypothetical protein
MTSTLIKFLAWAGLDKAMAEYAFSHQSKSYREYLEFAFTDSKGRKYYKFNDLKNMPLSMLEQLTILQLEVEGRIKGTDLDEWIKRCKEIASSGSKTAVADIGHMLGALEDRRGVLIEPVLLMEIAALLYVREDEDPTIYNKDLHKEKFKQFTDDCAKPGGLYDFFLNAGLARYMPSVSFTPIEWELFLKNQMAQIKAFKDCIGRIGGSESRLKSM